MLRKLSCDSFSSPKRATVLGYSFWAPYWSLRNQSSDSFTGLPGVMLWEYARVASPRVRVNSLPLGAYLQGM